MFADTPLRISFCVSSRATIHQTPYSDGNQRTTFEAAPFNR